MSDQRRPSPLTIRIGHDELVVRRRYETASILNDVCIALWFVAGSVMFFYASWAVLGTWCFLLGSLQLLVRPGIRLTRQLHLQRVRGRRAQPVSAGAESAQDY
ncbi:YrhK family protein [Streptomyces sp. DSM 42041]|uniref:YrhK family protein n=1 Tax=Streptomyces hazeniae TaxID=3075538 RepID=A0ABU2NMB0_9ACTN|nr:YrhK family protein [Streptomyces sp. DSM 42041]MDT0377890.1 YrhK family protein [Streptomyces sp. DSM 42041]